jgi:hypothetical protein
MTLTTAIMNSRQADRLLAARGPFASIYFDDSHETHDAAAQLAVKWHDLRRELDDQGADATLVSVLGQAVAETRPRIGGRSGRGLIAGPQGVLIDEPLGTAPATSVVRVSDLPYVVPLIHYGRSSKAFTVVAVDHVGADFTFHEGGNVRFETVDAGGYPVHESAGADVHGWGDSQHRVEESIRKNVRAVADHLTHEADRCRPEVVFVVGQDRARAELLSFLPERVTTCVVALHVGARHTGVDETVSHAIAAEFENRRYRAAGEIAKRFCAEMGRRSGIAVDGLADVCSALREGAVATLIIGDLANETVIAGEGPTMIAVDADDLSAFGAAPTRMLRADEAIPFAAMTDGAALVHADGGLDIRDGIGALLRYVPTDG